MKRWRSNFTAAFSFAGVNHCVEPSIIFLEARLCSRHEPSTIFENLKETRIEVGVNHIAEPVKKNYIIILRSTSWTNLIFFFFFSKP